MRSDALTIAMYSSDASLYQVAPLVIAYPENRDDVVAIVKYAADAGLPIIPRGAGSSVTGGPLGPGIVIDFSRRLNRIESFDDETVHVQAGVTWSELNRFLRPQGRYFAPDPANSAVTTIGGMLGVDAAGSHSVRVGSTRNHVHSMEVVLANGCVIEAGPESLDILQTMPDMGSIVEAERTQSFLAKRNLVSRLSRLLDDHAELIRDRQPPGVRNTAGYFLRSVLKDHVIHLPRMLIGSEGTLGVFTSARLYTTPLPAHRSAALILFGQLEGALRSVRALEKHQLSACDLLDRRLLSLAREADPRFHELISPAAEVALIVEQTGMHAKDVQDRMRAILQTVRDVNLRSVVAFEAETDADVEFLWTLPSRVVPLLTKLKGATRPLPFVEDMAVPPEAVSEFLLSAQRILQRHQVTASLYAHAAAGQLHMRPFLQPPQPGDGPRLEGLARDLYQLVFSLGGSISGEHGDGLSRTAFIRSQYGALYRVFQQIKDIFDPHNLLNPGKIISNDQHTTAKNFRPVAESQLNAEPELVPLQLQWSPQTFAAAADRCNGCGECRTQSPDLRMCPFFRQDPIEEASPRAKANLVRGVLAETIPADMLVSEEMQRVANLCFNCKQCQLECPSNVNIPQIMIEAKAAYVAANGLHRADWLLSRAHTVGALGSTLSLAANWLVSNGTTRWAIEKLTGISQHRKLPLFARRSFLRSLGSRYSEKPQPKPGQPQPIVYFVDDFANYFDPELAASFVAILRHHNVPIIVPKTQTSSGMALISAGDIEAAKEVAAENVRTLGGLAREGFQIVCTEPTSALCLRDEYPKVLDHPDVHVVANQTIDAGSYLLGLHKNNQLRTDFTELNQTIGYHTPCHVRALTDRAPMAELLALIPGLTVAKINRGCSGMAGAWGVSAKNFRTSLRLGWGLISEMRSGQFTLGATECSTCKMQMEQGTDQPTLHPLKLLALSYGLMPELEKKLSPSKNRLVLS
ncbi:FAD-binding and (Fe-S)-binding domain-containing protein [Thalassoroseus pseudoceratinae]|uniref:FAD-binding and (Fe-S)-binding domain-containing protein n=1 Tax=Thalassoroseus pseudoceratinae TaxID=2713176 RepID=UPI001F117C2E|nr:FAD-binding and (Fe-S)-binding domain-containing protein [Thalassoroseus pseudoceratinae]